MAYRDLNIHVHFIRKILLNFYFNKAIVLNGYDLYSNEYDFGNYCLFPTGKSQVNPLGSQ